MYTCEWRGRRKVPLIKNLEVNSIFSLILLTGLSEAVYVM
jgi:hypothetical protein